MDLRLDKCTADTQRASAAKPQTTYVYFQATKSSGSCSNYEEKGATNSAQGGHFFKARQ